MQGDELKETEGLYICGNCNVTIDTKKRIKTICIGQSQRRNENS